MQYALASPCRSVCSSCMLWQSVQAIWPCVSVSGSSCGLTVVPCASESAVHELLSAAISFGCAMSVEAYRVSLINTVVRVFNDLTDYRFSSALPSETDSKAFTPPVLSGLPDTMHKTDEHSTPNGYTVTYESTTDFLDLTCTRITDTSETHKLVDTENASVTEFALHGNPVTMIEKNGTVTLLWTHDDIVYHLYSSLPADTCRKLIENLQ